jgi:hypothetical protein
MKPMQRSDGLPRTKDLTYSSDAADARRKRGRLKEGCHGRREATARRPTPTDALLTFGA